MTICSTLRTLRISFLAAVVCFSLSSAMVNAAEPSSDPDQVRGGKELLGWVEWVAFAKPSLKLKAKLDSGATTSSLNAVNLKSFEKDGEEWVSFDVLNSQDQTKMIRMEAPVVRHARIRRHHGKTQERPVVKLGMCLGSVYRERQFTLVDRSNFSYQVLIGRNFMRGYVVIDVDESFTRDPACEETGMVEKAKRK